jgi:ABC-type Fe3+-hydroxamate transport system substrate-binding protein
MKLRCLTLLFATLILSGCSPEWLLKQAIKKDPTLLKTKTITVTDTVVTEPIVVRDTVTMSQVDTVEIVKDKFRVKIMRSYDTLIIDGGCDGDTIVRTVEVPVEQVVYKEEHKIFRWSFYLWVLVAVVAFVYALLRRGILPW